MLAGVLTIVQGRGQMGTKRDTFARLLSLQYLGSLFQSQVHNERNPVPAPPVFKMSPICCLDTTFDSVTALSRVWRAFPHPLPPKQRSCSGCRPQLQMPSHSR